jgi:5,10-methylenetetrahydrofolate reductase
MPVVLEPDSFGDEPRYLLVDYHRSPPAGAWTVSQAADGLKSVTLQATCAHEALHDAMDLIEALSQYANVAISTMHTLDGDPVAWANSRPKKASSTAPSVTAPSPT